MNRLKNIRQTLILTVIMMAMMPLCAFSIETKYYKKSFTDLKTFIENANPNSELGISLLSNFDNNYNELEEGNRSINISNGKNIQITIGAEDITRESEEFFFHISEGGNANPI